MPLVTRPPALRAEEANLLHALALARNAQHWADALGCLQGLSSCISGRAGTGNGPAWSTRSPRSSSTRPPAARCPAATTSGTSSPDTGSGWPWPRGTGPPPPASSRPSSPGPGTGPLPP